MRTHERTHRTMLWALLVIPLMTCVTAPWMVGSRSAQTENELYLEGRTWAAAADLGAKVERVVFSPTSVGVNDGQVAAGWVQNGEVWYWQDWVEHAQPSGMQEIAWHEVCHLSTKDTEHGRKWCSCMTERFPSTYCGG